ncbi:hypothetical protein NEIFLAOT_01051 [Neisseria flavescens NRL30031/H210]|uniref:Uncharacterized protein n=1 Tax=Neisseria flavescens NRL30031/H210 TaxID=546264 RepID=C0EM85_NEIFL|nr:hypothetical protein NEIFLAOT_01051 [Neisseria flavescens NRL30031/H210]
MFQTALITPNQNNKITALQTKNTKPKSKRGNPSYNKTLPTRPTSSCRFTSSPICT